MTTMTQIIELRPYLPQDAPLRRRRRRPRGAALCAAVVALAEVAASLAIGLCVLICTGAFLQML